VQTQAGHDLVEMRMHFPWLYEPQLLDVSDLVAELEKKYGKPRWRPRRDGHVKGTWRAVPQYRRSSCRLPGGPLQEGRPEDPGHVGGPLHVGKELKKMGHPIGIPISQNYDSISTASPMLWAHGAKEVDKDGKTVTINSPPPAEVVELYKKMYRDCMEPEVLSWTGRQQQRVAPAGARRAGSTTR
jgi:hypothetical protein